MDMNALTGSIIAAAQTVAADEGANMTKQAELPTGPKDACDDVQRVHIGLYVNPAETIEGIALGFVNRAKKAMVGFGLAIFGNVSGGDMTGMQVGIGGNLSGGDMTGLQVGIMNIASNSMMGLQVAVFNVSGGNMDLLKVGFVNYATGDMNGVNIGILNIWHENGATCWSPIANFGCIPYI